MPSAKPLPGASPRRGSTVIILNMNLGFSEMLFIFFIALLIFGPKKLPEIGRQIGEAMTQFKRASNEFKAQLEDEIRNLEADEARKKIGPPEPPAPTQVALETIPREHPVTPFNNAHADGSTPGNGSGETLSVPPEQSNGREGA